MKTLLSVVLVSFSLVLFAQKSATLAVTGNASVSVKPTITVISMNVSSTQDSYTNAIEELVNRIDQLTKAMQDIGFKPEEIITSNFNINKRFNYNQGKQKVEEYTAQQQLKVQFEMSKKRLLEVINTATASKALPEINISFDLDIDRKKQLKNKLIKLAIADAKEKAGLMAQAADLTIEQILEISYGVTNYNPSPMNVGMRALAMDEVVVTNMEVSNLTFSESVEMQFSAINK